MVFTVDLSNDYLLIDFLESITYYIRVNETTYQGTFNSEFNSEFDVGAVAVNNTLHVPELKNSIQSGNDLAQKTSIWQVWEPEIDFVPKRGDAFTDEEGNSWQVQSVDFWHATARYQLHCFEFNHGMAT